MVSIFDVGPLPGGAEVCGAELATGRAVVPRRVGEPAAQEALEVSGDVSKEYKLSVAKTVTPKIILGPPSIT